VAHAPAAPTGFGGIVERVLDWLEGLPGWLVGLGLAAAALAAYWLPGSERFYNHFVWQAMAFLHGQVAIPWPVEGAYGSGTGNGWMQDVYPLRDAAGNLTGEALIPFPPLPAIVLLPFAALWGFATDIRAVSAGLGAIDVAIAWWALGRLAVSHRIRLATTLFFAFGTVLWYAAQLGTTWFFAHVVAVTATLLAVGTALGGDAAADHRPESPPNARALAVAIAAALRAPWRLLDGRQFVAGLLFGLAATARLSVIFGAPFFVLVGSGGSWLRRAVSAGFGAAIPVGLLIAYNVASTGQVIHPGYDYQYQLEAAGYPGLDYHVDWGIEDPRYLPQNLGILFLSAPAILPDETQSSVSPHLPLCTAPDAARSLFDRDCPLAIPRDVGMSIVLTSPAYLLVVPALRRRRSRLVVGAAAAVVAIGLFNLMHFSQGWVQFGYRFANDFAPFAVLLVAIGMARRGGVGLLGGWLIGLSMVVNLWGVIWGNILGW
jgi:hypothetical protein